MWAIDCGYVRITRKRGGDLRRESMESERVMCENQLINYLGLCDGRFVGCREGCEDGRFVGNFVGLSEG